jgi:hypothetical protein
MQPLYVTLTQLETPFDVITLPIHFRYTLPEMNRRITQRPTCGGAVIQQSSLCYTVEGSIIPFTMYPACPTEYKMFDELYRDCLEVEGNPSGSRTYLFEGYWNEGYNVIPYVLDPPEIQGRVFKVSGSFMVMCEVTPPSPVNNLYD